MVMYTLNDLKSFFGIIRKNVVRYVIIIKYLYHVDINLQ